MNAIMNNINYTIMSAMQLCVNKLSMDRCNTQFTMILLCLCMIADVKAMARRARIVLT